MSGSLPQLQQHALERAEEFCARYAKPRRAGGRNGRVDSPARRPQPKPGSFYRPRDPEASPLFRVVRDHFDEFENVYPARYQKAYGYWRPVIRASIDKFVKCGDFKEGFARVRCPDCKAEYMVAFSCRARSCCPSCDQKRSLLRAQRLNAQVFEAVPHRQWVFTIPRRLSQAAYGAVCDVYGLDPDAGNGVPAMVSAVQTFGDMMNWHPHVHGVVAEGVFSASGEFVHIPDVRKDRVEEFWQERVFALLLDSHKIDDNTAGSMRSWRHSGFSVDTSVCIEGNDRAGMSRLVGYISRCPLSLARMVTRTDDGKIVYRASHATCWAFPMSSEQTVMKGIPRNHEISEPLDFLAEMTQHIPDPGEHQISYYGWYSNKARGIRQKGLREALVPKDHAPLTQQQLRFKLTWAALIKLVYEVDPLKCPNCGGTMKVVALIDQSRQPGVVERILRHCGLWKTAPPRPPAQPREPEVLERALDFGFFDPDLTSGHLTAFRQRTPGHCSALTPPNPLFRPSPRTIFPPGARLTTPASGHA